MSASFPEWSPATAGSGEHWVPETEAERDAVRQQLGRLLESPLFCSSKRYPNLLKYIVEETLAGRSGRLKERTLGIEVFGRNPDYDTNQDPVVRTSAAKVRYRLNHYYLEPEHESEIRIDLLPGSYVPQFRLLAGGPVESRAAHDTPVSSQGEPAVTADEAVPAPVGSGEAAVPLKKRRSAIYARVIGIIALIAVAGVAVALWRATDAVTKFWGQVWGKSSTVVICVPGKFPTAEAASRVARDPSRRGPLSIIESLRLNSIAWPDATALYTLAGFIESHGRQYQVRRAGDSALSDLRTGPAVLIGGLNNPWLLRLSSRYRFTYRNDPDLGQAWIEDAQDPSQRTWKVDWDLPYSTFEEDYGIISRVWDPTTEGMVVTASGIASYGTIAAGEFLTNPRYLAMMSQRAPAGWERKSVQVVFATKVFNGNAGPPKILVVHVW